MNKEWKLAIQYPNTEFCDFCGKLLEKKDERYHNEEGEVMCEGCADELETLAKAHADTSD